jgi:hypothetical protein
MQQLDVKFYCFVVQILLNMFRALLCPSSGAHQTAVAASRFQLVCSCGRFVSGETHCLPANKLTTAENTSTSTFIWKPEAATAV